VGAIRMKDTDLYEEDKDQAEELWAKGFRPINIADLKKGDSFAYWNTDVFRLGGVGSYMIDYADSIEIENCTVRVKHGSITTEADDGDVVWAKT
jgi:trans-2-enoyl-CoA reductase